MAIAAVLTPSPIPSNTLNGVMPIDMFHVTIAPASGAGTYTFAHGLAYTPTAVFAIPEISQGTTPTIAVGWDKADTSATVVALNFSGNCTCDVYFG